MVFKIATNCGCYYNLPVNKLF